MTKEEEALIKSPDWVRPKDAQKILSCSASTLHRLVYKYGLLDPPNKPGRKTCYYFVPNLIAYIKNTMDEKDWEMVILQRVLTSRLISFEETYLRDRKKGKAPSSDDVTMQKEMGPLLRQLDARNENFSKAKIDYYLALKQFLPIVEAHNNKIEAPRADSTKAHVAKAAESATILPVQ